MRTLIPALLLSLAAASAQPVELGANAGFGGYSVEGVKARRYITFGAESCFLCSGRFALFAEYSHWEATEQGSSRANRLDLASGGLRLQGRGRVRPFFDIGATGGADQVKYYSGQTARHGLVGLLLGGGVALPLGERWYIRPQVRLHTMTNTTASAVAAGFGASVGIGYRF